MFLVKLMRFKCSALEFFFTHVIFLSPPVPLHMHRKMGGLCIFSPQRWSSGRSKYCSHFLLHMTCLNKYRCYSLCTENDETLYDTPSQTVYFISLSLRLEWSGKLYWLNITRVKIRLRRHSKRTVAVMNAPKREDFIKQGGLQPRRTDRISKYGSKITFPASRHILDRLDPRQKGYELPGLPRYSQTSQNIACNAVLGQQSELLLCKANSH